ncbi:MAG: replication restart helicase PriA [Elusimicrobiota bacterium]
MDRRNIAEIVPLNIHLDKSFHYLIPSNFKKDAQAGKRVIIPFRNKKKIGLITRIVSESAVKNLKEIEGIVDPFPVLSPEVLTLTDWISKYYLCPKGTIINYIIPSRVSKKKIESLVKEYSDRGEIIQDENISVRNKEYFPNDFLKPLLFHYHNKKTRDRYYSQWIGKILGQGKQVLILVPDKWSCSHLKKKLTNKYGKIVGVFDKKVNQTQKYLRFLQVQKNDLKIVIGTRSNIFLPFRNLGLVIIDEENSLLYKEERTPRYNAREVALIRGKLGAFKILLGSFAPSVESYWRVEDRRYFFKTEKHISKYHKYFPQIQVINMEEEKSFQKIISFRLQQQIIRCLRENNKIVLFLNRRGFSGYMICSQCGHVIKCPDCGHLLACHIEENTKWIVCHICGKKVMMDKYCPECKNGKIKPLGAGTQYVETLIKRMFPRAIIQRLDIDIAPKMNNQKKIINEFNQNKIDILIGTQLLFRELDYKNVGLLGLILVDHMLNIPNYQSAELTFQFIYQLALNISACKTQKDLYIQTYQPDHHSLQAIEQLNYTLFYQREMLIRDELKYPPFTAMIKIDFTGKNNDQIRKSVRDFINYAQKTGIISKYRLDFQLSMDNLMIVKEKDRNKASYVLRINPQKENINYFKNILFQYILKYQSNDVKLMIDIDPRKML